MDGVAIKPLTVSFSEPGFIAKLNQENQFGPWFTLSDKKQQQLGSPMGPQNPQALNRYSYVLNNPVRYTDPTGHRRILAGYSYEQVAAPKGTYGSVGYTNDGSEAFAADDGIYRVKNGQKEYLYTVCNDKTGACKNIWGDDSFIGNIKDPIDSVYSVPTLVGIAAFARTAQACGGNTACIALEVGIVGLGMFPTIGAIKQKIDTYFPKFEDVGMPQERRRSQPS
jgi:hypothetical protein